MSGPVRMDEAAASVAITIDGRPVTARAGASVLDAALAAGLYIPHLCHHPSLGAARGARSLALVFRAGERVEGDAGSAGTAFAGCGLCIVRVEGMDDPCPACDLPAAAGLAVHTNTSELAALRRSRLAPIP